MIDIKYRRTGADRRSLAWRRPRSPVLVSLAVVLAVLMALAGFLPAAQALAGLKGAEAVTITSTLRR